MQPQLKVRRARRDDFERIRALLGIDEAATRSDRKRFRRLVSTLREDLYLVERGDDLAVIGLAVIAYARGLEHPTAIVRQLRSATDIAASLLLDCARTRAVARGCTRLELQADATLLSALPRLGEMLAGSGWIDGPRTLVCALSE
jgi:hypothetical protein